MTIVRIRLLWHKQAQFAGYLLAEKLRLGAKYGVEIVCEGLDPNCRHVESVLTGASQMAVASPAHILESADPAALLWLLTFQQESPLVYPVRKKMGIEKPADLAGRKVGVWPGHEDLELRWLLQAAGLEPDAAERMPMPDTVGPFLRGEIDCAQMTNYHELHHVEETLGASEISVFSARDFGCSILKDGLAVSSRFADANGDIVQAVVNSVLEGWKIAFLEPDRAIAACVEARLDVSEAEHRRQLADIRSLSLTGASLSRGLGYPDQVHVQQAARAIAEVENKAVDASSVLEDSFWWAAPEELRPRIAQ